MAEIKINDYDEYAKKAPMVYEVRQLAQSGYTKKDYRSLCEYLQKLMRKYPWIAFYLVFSTTDSQGECHRETVHTGNLGRPKQKIVGMKIAPHIHLLIINLSAEKNIDEVEYVIREHLRKLHEKKPSIKRFTGRPFDNKKTPSLHAGNFYRYLKRQADHTCVGGQKHNWSYYESIMWHN